MRGYILRLIFDWDENEFENYERMIRIYFINIGLILNKLIISIGVEINIFSRMIPLLLETNFIEKLSLDIEKKMEFGKIIKIVKYLRKK